MEFGLVKFVNNKFLSDVTIKIDDKAFKAHKVVIAGASVYYYRIFEDESKKEIPFPPYIEPKFSRISPKDLFENVLKFIYSNQESSSITDSLNEHTANAYLAMAYSLGIQCLTELSCDFIISHLLNPQNSVDYIAEGLKFYSEPLTKAATTQLLANFQELSKDKRVLDSMIALPYKTVLSIVSSDELKVDSEKMVFEFISSYAINEESPNRKRITEEEVFEIFSQVRWPFLSHSDLLEAASDPRISICKDMILEGLSVQLSEHIKPENYVYKVNRTPRNSYAVNAAPESSQSKKSTKSGELPIRFFSKSTNNWKSYNKGFGETAQPRPPQDFFAAKSQLRDFVYSYDLDENGVFFYLGSRSRLEEWKNPHLTGTVTCFSSSVSCGKIEDLAGRTLSNFRTKNEVNAFIGVDLGFNRALKVTAYTIKNGNSSSNTMISWVFQGSVNGVDWVILDRRVHGSESDVKYLSEKGKTSTWGVAESEKSFRFFRVTQSDKNLSGNYMISISCLELYGTPSGKGWDLVS